MSLRVGEVGKTIRVNTGYDLSSNTELTLVFTKPGGTTVSKTTADGITAPSVDVTADDGSTFTADEYMSYNTESGFLDESGTWQVYAQYDDATPKTFIGDTTTFQVLPTS